MRRREFITIIGGAAAWLMTGQAQQPAMPVIGFLHPGSPEANEKFATAVAKVLEEAGDTDGRNVVIEYRWAHGEGNRLPEFAADLVRRRVTVIATLGGIAATVAAKAATTAIPIVFLAGADPVQAGVVSS